MNDGILSAGHHLFDPEHIVAVSAQRPNGGAGHVLIREKAHEFSP